MLSKEQNEILTRSGPNTPMGDLVRQFWVPALRSAKLEVDGTPVRVQLLGQDFIAFRDTNGRVGFLDEGCPHRGVSLALGRNEECGLRCIFHGWKMNVDGQVVEVPSEPEGSNLASKVKVNHYTVREAAGVVWVWLGKGEQVPQFPDFGFDRVPLENTLARKAIVKCNWVALLEGLLDSSHVTSLHKAWLPQGDKLVSGPHAGVMGALSLRYEIEERPYGMMANAKRKLPGGGGVHRKTEYVLPWTCLIPNTFKTLRGISMVVPIDDETTNFWSISWDTTGPLDPVTVDQKRGTGLRGSDPDDTYFPRADADRIWGQDRELMKQGNYAGFLALPFEDYAVAESQGVIADRSKEHLGASDVAIIRVRRFLLDTVQNYHQGKIPAIFTNHIDYLNIRPVHEVLDSQQKPVEVSI